MASKNGFYYRMDSISELCDSIIEWKCRTGSIMGIQFYDRTGVESGSNPSSSQTQASFEDWFGISILRHSLVVDWILFQF